MVYRGERMYPGRTARMNAGKTRSVGGICLVLILVAVMVTSLTVSYVRLLASEKAIANSSLYNVQLSEKIEYYETEINRLTSKEEVTRRAEELGLIENKTANRVTIPGRS